MHFLKNEHKAQRGTNSVALSLEPGIQNSGRMQNAKQLTKRAASLQLLSFIKCNRKKRTRQTSKWFVKGASSTTTNRQDCLSWTICHRESKFQRGKTLLGSDGHSWKTMRCSHCYKKHHRAAARQAPPVQSCFSGRLLSNAGTFHLAMGMAPNWILPAAALPQREPSRRPTKPLWWRRETSPAPGLLWMQPSWRPPVSEVAEGAI